MENLIEKQIGNYKIAEIIGQGGMGKVYKGLHVSLERTVALKMIHPKFLSNSEIVERFYKEAKIQARLNHPNIVAIYDIIEHDHNHYIVMEYIKGEVISKIIEHQGPFDQETALTIFKQILEGINYAHSKNVIHKDIKTSNFLITPTEVKIMDFGIAEIIGKSEIDTTAGVLGTPKYMSPELILM